MRAYFEQQITIFEQQVADASRDAQQAQANALVSRGALEMARRALAEWMKTQEPPPV